MGLAKLKGKTRAFDLTVAQSDIDDTNDDGYRDFRDIAGRGQGGDQGGSQEEEARARAPFKAYAFKDLTHPRPPRIN